MTLQLNEISKRYETVEAVKRAQLNIREGELLVLVGPSGCGKTTILRILGGLVSPDEGSVVFRNKDITRMPPEERPTVTVFQDYALFPHMNVYQNISYGLKVRGVDKKETMSKVNHFMKLMKIEGMENRSISALSGGQKQRVALARAMVVDPDILLFDEPLSSLDAKLRVEMREEIKSIQQQTGITAVYVTHDQEEALAIADRVAVMNHGVIEQIGTPEEIYYQPASPFVANFIGYGNFTTTSKLKKQADGIHVSLFGSTGLINSFDNLFFVGSEMEYCKKGMVFIRPEDTVPHEQGDFSGKVVQKSFLGAVTRYLIQTANGETIKMDTPSSQHNHEVGESIRFIIKRLHIIEE